MPIPPKDAEAMATVTLSREEALIGRLPPTCMRCGVAAGEYQVIFFPPRPWWIYTSYLLGFLPLLVWVLLPSQQMELQARLCEHHAKTWRWRPDLLLALLILSTIFFGFWVLFLADALPGATNHPGQGLDWDFVACMLGFGVPACGLPLLLTIFDLFLHLTSIRAKRITKESITLTGVADEFVESLRVHRAARMSEGDHPTTDQPAEATKEPRHYDHTPPPLRRHHR
jgi:hypothetical protein